MINKDKCGICGKQQFEVIGAGQHDKMDLPDWVVGRLGDGRYEIRRCRYCHFCWKSPQLANEDYLNYYKICSLKDWVIDQAALKARRFKRKKQFIERLASGRRILDIGCFQGDFLGSLGDGWERFGIEQNDGARQACLEKGIRVIGCDIDDLPGSNTSFDVICLIDILEHLSDPLEGLKLALGSLKEKGALVIETGDMDSLFARVMGGDWHYYTYFGHISFFSKRSLRVLCEKLDITPAIVRRWPHMIRGRWHVTKQCYKALSYKWPVIRPRHLLRCLWRQGRIPKKEGFSPWLTGISDHIFMVGIKTD